MNISQAKQEFLEYLEIEKGRSIKTIENYNRYITRFFDHAKIQNPSDITEEVLREFRLWLNSCLLYTSRKYFYRSGSINVFNQALWWW